MAHKDIDRLLDGQTGDAPAKPVEIDEFDRAVTTRISLDQIKALDDDVTDDPAAVRVVDAEIAAHIQPAQDDILDNGFFLKDRFEIVELVHSSAMGHVYKAVDHRRHPEGSGEIHVAIKMMRRSIASQREAGLALEREAAKAQSLSHPNIINIFDFDQHDGQFFLVMEWLDGESVNALLRRTSGQGVSPRVAWKVIEGAAAALQHAHRNNVVHADINPSNVFVTDTGDIKLLDFGVARYSGDSVNDDDSQFAWVTRTYASPQILSGMTPDYEDDVFSLGCVAYRLLCGKHPFDGVPSLVARRKGVTLQRVDGLTDSDWHILSQVLSYESADRPNDVALFLSDDSSPGDSYGAQALAVRRHDSIDAQVIAVRRSDAIDTHASFVRPTDSSTRIGIAAVAAVVMISGAWWLLQRQNDVIDPLPGNNGAQMVAPSAADAPSAAEALVSVATQAINAGEFVTETGDDARTLFRYAVAMDPNNAAALRGLRTISDVYVQQANDALRSGEIAEAYAAIEIATETDAGNPSIAITNQLIVAQGDSVLADARLAASAGNWEIATEQLSRAAEYSHINPENIELIRQQISQIEGDEQLLSGLLNAERQITAGRLTPPGLDNAYAILTRLRQSHGDDARLLASMERLGERLLMRAAFSTAASKFEDATELLDAVDDLGVLSSEVGLARESLRASEQAFKTEEIPAIASPVEAAADEVPQVATAPDAMNDADIMATTEGPDLLAVLGDSESAGDKVFAMNAPTQSAVPDESAPPRLDRIEDKGITRYVAPVYPRRALQRGITGRVDIQFNITTDGRTDAIDVLSAAPDNVFEASAVNAVKKWRFEPRDDVDRLRVSLRFELPP